MGTSEIARLDWNEMSPTRKLLGLDVSVSARKWTVTVCPP